MLPILLLFATPESSTAEAIVDSGDILVAGFDSLLKVDPDTGQQERLADLSSGSRGIAVYGMVQYPMASRLSGDRGAGPYCGLGVELALVLAPLLLVARRTRRIHA